MDTHVLLSRGLAVVVEMRVSHSLGLYARRQDSRGQQERHDSVSELGPDALQHRRD